MESDKIFFDRDYKKVCSAIGWSLVMFLVIFDLASLGVSRFSEEAPLIYTYEVAYTLSAIIESAAYLLSFLLPALFLKLFLKRGGVLCHSSYFLSFERRALLLIPATIAAALVSSYINARVMSVFDADGIYQSLVGIGSTRYEGYQIILLYISTALVPAFCEEFFFRGTILANLAPYGKKGAVVISSLTFALMHQDPYKIIYTFVAGLMLGMVYIKTCSVWLPTLIHFINNAYSTTNQVLYSNLDGVLASVFIELVWLLIIIGGTVCFFRYIKLERAQRGHKFDGGFFGKEDEFDHRYAQKPITRGYAFKGFFRPSMIIFTVFSVLSMLAILIYLGFMNM